MKVLVLLSQVHSVFYRNEIRANQKHGTDIGVGIH